MRLFHYGEVVDTIVYYVARAPARTAEPISLRLLLHLCYNFLGKLNESLHFLNHVLIRLLQAFDDLLLFVGRIFSLGSSEPLVLHRDLFEEFLCLRQITPRLVVVDDFLHLI